jgi:hypothetical protein
LGPPLPGSNGDEWGNEGRNGEVEAADDSEIERGSGWVKIMREVVGQVDAV